MFHVIKPGGVRFGKLGRLEHLGVQNILVSFAHAISCPKLPARTRKFAACVCPGLAPRDSRWVGLEHVSASEPKEL